MKDCIFCKIAQKEIPAQIIYETKECMAFLDIKPAMEGQTVVISKQHAPSDFKKTPDEILQKTIVAAKKTAQNLDKTLNSRSCLVVEGFDIDHLHFKLYPTTPEKHLKLTPQILAKPEKLQRLAKRISKLNKELIHD